MFERLTARSPKNGMAYLINVKQNEQDVESPYPNTLRCIMDSFNRLAAYEDTGLTPEEVQGLAKAKSEGRLVVLPEPQKSDYPGLKVKYRVYKAKDNTPVENCFVLRPNKDPAAISALTAYAKTTDNNCLAEDILNWITPDEKVLVLPCKVGDIVYVRSGCLFYKDAAPYTPCEVVVIKRGKRRGTMMHLRPLCEEAVGTRYHRWFPVTSIGLTVFLTREAAEKAIAEVGE